MDHSSSVRQDSTAVTKTSFRKTLASSPKSIAVDQRNLHPELSVDHQTYLQASIAILQKNQYQHQAKSAIQSPKPAFQTKFPEPKVELSLPSQH
jgi:hypothetical protein